jgi:hypothetical protein
MPRHATTAGITAVIARTGHVDRGEFEEVAVGRTTVADSSPGQRFAIAPTSTIR